jgi:predicted kinase
MAALSSLPMSPRLFLLCGKMAAGKSTLARALARREKAVLLVQDEFLERLFPGEITDVPSFARCSTRLAAALSPLIGALLAQGTPIVLDFPGNTRTQRAWFRRLIDDAQVGHELHFVDVPDDVCKVQLKQRSRDLPDGSAWTTAAEFDAITAYFQPPSADEGFNVVRHAGGVESAL